MIFNEECSIVDYPEFLWNYSSIPLGGIEQLKEEGLNEREIVERYGWTVLEEAEEFLWKEQEN